jgi:hypothetical protein
VIAFWLPQTGKFNDNFEEETLKDQHGFDLAWLARNQHIMGDVAFKIAGISAASPSSVAQLSSQVWPLAMLSTVTLSGFAFTVDNAGNGGLNGAYQYVSGSDLNLDFSKVNEATFKLRKYVDPTQNTLANTTPN